MTVDIYKPPFELAWPRLCRVSNESQQNTKQIIKFNRQVTLALEHSIVS